MSPEKPQTAGRPEKKIGPYPGGIGVAIWLNTLQTKDGRRKVRSITINPRRYKDQNGKWQDSASYRIGDLPALIYALQKAQEYMFNTPIAGDEADTSTPPF